MQILKTLLPIVAIFVLFCACIYVVNQRDYYYNEYNYAKQTIEQQEFALDACQMFFASQRDEIAQLTNENIDLTNKIRRLVDEATRCGDAMDTARERIENLRKSNSNLVGHLEEMAEVNQSLLAKIKRLEEMLGQCNNTQPIEPAPPIPGCK